MAQYIEAQLVLKYVAAIYTQIRCGYDCALLMSSVLAAVDLVWVVPSSQAVDTRCATAHNNCLFCSHYVCITVVTVLSLVAVHMYMCNTVPVRVCVCACVRACVRVCVCVCVCLCVCVSV